MNRGHRGIGSALRSADRYRQRIADQIYQQQEEARSAYPRFSSVDPLLMRDLYFESLEIDFRRKYGAEFAPYLAEAKLDYDRSNGYITDTSDDCDRSLDSDSCASDAADLEAAPIIPSDEMEQHVADVEVQHTVVTVEPSSDSELELDDHEVLVFQDEPVVEASVPLVRPIAVVAPTVGDVAACPSTVDNSSLSSQIKQGLLSACGAAQSWLSSLTEMISQHYDRIDVLSNLVFNNNYSYCRILIAGLVILFSLPDFVYAKSGVLAKVLYVLYIILSILYLICTGPSADFAAGEEQAHALAPRPGYFDIHAFE